MLAIFTVPEYQTKTCVVIADVLEVLYNLCTCNFQCSESQKVIIDLRLRMNQM